MTVGELIEALSALPNECKDLPVTFVNVGAGWADGRCLIKRVTVVKTDSYERQDPDFDFDQLIELESNEESFYSYSRS